MDIEKLIKLLRYCATTYTMYDCSKCVRDNNGQCDEELMSQAADALEELQAELNVYKSLLKQLILLPDCNTCDSEHCTYRPNIGAFTRINCPLWRGQKED